MAEQKYLIIKFIWSFSRRDEKWERTEEYRSQGKRQLNDVKFISLKLVVTNDEALLSYTKMISACRRIKKFAEYSSVQSWYDTIQRLYPRQRCSLLVVERMVRYCAVLPCMLLTTDWVEHIGFVLVVVRIDLKTIDHVRARVEARASEKSRVYD